MMLTFERVNYQGIRKLIFVATKITVAFLILKYFGANLVMCNEDISFCDKRLKELKQDVKDWNKRCVNTQGKDIGTPCCETEKQYNKERMKMQTKLCFYKGIIITQCILRIE
jgi:CMP-2-keto-3-deoxyoctulosonic acid synthetase